jgi:uncharacterized protein (DUF885 family)
MDFVARFSHIWFGLSNLMYCVRLHGIGPFAVGEMPQKTTWIRTNVYVAPSILSLSVILVAAICLMSGGRSVVFGSGPGTTGPASNTDPQFRAALAKFIDSEMRLSPEGATEAGDHRFDGKLSDFSPAGIEAKIRHARFWKTQFLNWRGALSAPNQADREWLAAVTDEELLWEEEVKSYRSAPGRYLPTEAIDSLIKRDFAPLPQRMASVASRERAALTNLAQARVNLKPATTSKVAVDIVLEQMPGTIDFFRKDVPQVFATLPPSGAKRDFLIANSRLIAAIAGYQQWLKKFRRSAAGGIRLGPHAFRRMLADDDMVDTPPERLEKLGRDELARLQDQFKQTAARIDGKRPPEEVFKSIASRHPEPSELIADVSAGLAQLRTFVIEHHVATVSAAQLPLVRDTPPFARATTFASMDTPGPLEKKALAAYFYVTLPDPSWPASRVGQLLEFFSPPAISNTSVHEVYPGHFIQFLDNRDNPDLVRSLFYSGANVEGWAFYCEQMMLDEGLHGDAPEYRLVQLQMALQRVCRYLVALAMHTGSMTVPQAAQFFRVNAYMPANNAMMEALRGTQDPGYLRYQLGKFMILKLRDDVRQREGAAFNLEKFHDAFLAQGGLPIKLIRRALLGADNGSQL